MADEGNPNGIWRFELYRLKELPDILAIGHSLQSDVNRDHARELFAKSYEDPYFYHPHRQVEPAGIRFFDRTGAEVLRYTVEDYWRDRGGRPESDSGGPG